MAFKDLKSNKNQFSKLKNKIENEDKKDFSDSREWRPTVDASGNGYAVIRFLPAPDGEDMPYVKVFRHNFKVGSRYFIESCPTTLGQDCPVCEANSELWNTDIPMNQDIVRKRKRSVSYIANILVISDRAHPENEGKVFLFKFGAKIFAKIKGAIDPEFEDEKPFNPFNFWEGANFKLKIRNVENYRNYDKSEFDSTSALFDGDDKALEALWKSQYSLAAEVAEDKFKSYDELKHNFERVVQVAMPPARPTQEPQEEIGTVAWPTSSVESTRKDDEDDLDFYSRLIDNDE